MPTVADWQALQPGQGLKHKLEKREGYGEVHHEAAEPGEAALGGDALELDNKAVVLVVGEDDPGIPQTEALDVGQTVKNAESQEIL